MEGAFWFSNSRSSFASNHVLFPFIYLFPLWFWESIDAKYGIHNPANYIIHLQSMPGTVSSSFSSSSSSSSWQLMVYCQIPLMFSNRDHSHSCATLNCNSIRCNPNWGNFFFPSSLLVDYKMQAVQDYYLQKVKKTKSSGCINNRVRKSPFFPSKQYVVAFDDDSIDIVTESDLDGYESYGTSCDSIIMVTQSELDGYDSSCNSSTVTQILLPCFWVKLLLPGTNTHGFGAMQGRRRQGRSSEAQWLKSRFFERWMPIESVLHLNSHQWMLKVLLEQIMMFHGKSLIRSYGISREC